MRFLPNFTICLLTATFWSACSSSTASSVDEDDDAESSSSVLKSSSSAQSSSSNSDKVSEPTDKDSESSNQVTEPAEVIGEDCVGEPGNPWDGTTAKEFACGSGTKLSPYVILTAEQLAHLSFVIGAKDKDYLEKYYKLGADIILNEGTIIDDKGALVADSSKLHKWTPIGNSSVAFAGNFDGNGHSISGMFINTTSTHNGLFGNSSGTIQNLTVENGWVSGGKYTAGVVGSFSSDGAIRNSHNKASVTGSGEGTGGIAGTKAGTVLQKTAKIEKCTNRGVIKGKKRVAGIVGIADNYLEITDVLNDGLVEGEGSVAGIVGYLGSNTTVELAVNKGNIYGKENTAGLLSFAGYFYGSATSRYGTIDRSINYGNVEGTKYTGGTVGEAVGYNILSVSNYGNVSGTEFVGGMAGYSKYSTMKSIYNVGNITGASRVGGVIGYNEEGVTSSAYSTGKVDGDSLVGLVIGYNYNTTMADYYYLKQGDQEPFGLNNSGGVATSKTAEEMKSEEFAKLLGEDFKYDSGLNDGYPVLEWEKE